jgi:hypothetical protein
LAALGLGLFTVLGFGASLGYGASPAFAHPAEIEPSVTWLPGCDTIAIAITEPSGAAQSPVDVVITTGKDRRSLRLPSGQSTTVRLAQVPGQATAVQADGRPLERMTYYRPPACPPPAPEPSYRTVFTGVAVLALAAVAYILLFRDRRVVKR